MVSRAFPRAPRDALPGATLVEDAGKRQRETQIPLNTPPGDLGGWMDSHSTVSPEEKWCSLPAEVPQMSGQQFPRCSMTRAHRGERRLQYLAATLKSGGAT